MTNFYVYKLIHPETGQFYFGSRRCYCEISEDSYKGSMCGWKITKEEKQKLIKEIIKSDFKNIEEMITYEGDLVRKHIDDKLNENYAIPNPKFQSYNKVTVKTENGKVILVNREDPDYLSGKLKFIHCGKVTVRSGDSIIMVDVEDPRYISGELEFIHKGFVNVLDSEGNHFKVNKEDYRFLNGELKSSSKDTVLVFDELGNKFRVSTNDDRYIKGELKFIASGKALVKDKDGKSFYVNINDPRYLSGELVGNSKGYWSHATHLIIDGEFNSALHFSKKYGVRIKDLKQFLENNHIDYVKKIKQDYDSDINKKISTAKDWSWNLKILIDGQIATVNYFSSIYQVKVSRLKNYLEFNRIEYKIISKTKNEIIKI